jgi:hypothetical protein
MRHLHPVAALTVCLVVGSCSTEPAPDLDHLKNPTLYWIQFAGLCSKAVAADGDGRVRIGQACEKGPQPLETVADVAPETFGSIRARIELLPVTNMPIASCSGSSAHLFGVRANETLERSVCVDRNVQLGDTAGLVEPFLSVAEMFQALSR